ncbi:glutathione-regulated potassium-efflux system protein KefB [Pseudomonas aeruginosa]
MEHGSSFLQSGVVFLIAAVFMVPLAKRLQLGAVLGYLLAGVLIGPSVLGLVDNPESVAQISEMGVVLLLFIIGLELSPRRLWVMRKSVFGVGLLQVLLTGVVIGTVALVGFDQPVNSAVVLGLGLALSSTAFGLQILAERKELTQPHGRLAFAILLFQDIAAIPLIAMIPLLSGAHSDAGGSELTQTLKVVGSIAAVVVGGRYLLRPVFRIVAQTKLQDMSTATALLVVMGTALLMELAGVSMALGAFLAGLLLADSEYRHELEAQIEPFKGLLLGLFFISVGMSADISLLLKSPWMVLGLTVLLIALKAPVLYFVGRISGGLDKASALRLGVVLAAGGEFAFVVFKMARDQGLFQNDLHNLLVLSITLSMALTPLLVLGLARLLAKEPFQNDLHNLLVLSITLSMALTPLLVLGLARLLAKEPEATKPPPEMERIDNDDTPRVVIAGVGRMGQIVARVLRAQRVPFIALDTSVETIELTRTLGAIPIFYGDPMRPEILRAAQVEKAEFFVIATDDPETNIETAKRVRKLYPHLKIIARARNRQHVHLLLDAGVEPVRETFFSSLEMSRMVLCGLGLSEEQADARIRRFRRHDEEVLASQHLFYNDRDALIKSAREARVELETLFQTDQLEDRGAVAAETPEKPSRAS